MNQGSKQDLTATMGFTTQHPLQMEIRNQVFGISKAFFHTPGETPEAMVGLLRKEKNLVSLQMCNSQGHFELDRSTTYVTLSEAKGLVLCKTGSFAFLKRDSSSLRSSE